MADIHYRCIVEGLEVTVGRYADSPHGPNEEMRCALKDFIEQDNATAGRIKSFILENLGVEILAEVEEIMSKT